MVGSGGSEGGEGDGEDGEWVGNVGLRLWVGERFLGMLLSLSLFLFMAIH
jgi:hypothetical protein